jgi:hypothetical protein
MDDPVVQTVACPTCHQRIGKACESRPGFRLKFPHEERRTAAHQLEPTICPACGQLCQERDFYWGMLDARQSDSPRQTVCGYCTNWGVF